MSTRHGKSSPRTTRRTAVAVAFALFGLAVTGTGVYAALNAVATNSQSVSSGTLSLTISPESTSGGLTTTISNMAPGDTVNRFVDLTNGGSLAASGLTLQAADATPTTLDGTLNTASAGLQVAVTQCSVAWTVTTGVCSGTTTSLLASTPVHTVIGSAQTLLSGAVAAGAVTHLEVSISLAGTETTTNGTAPANTIQGQTDTVTWTFGEVQRAATTTNS